ncbi:hypothetical protein RJT34_29280 [Clitoria ternatea]|uniref:Uncharacterized protein n=1 Tax=Clitoria ternatea TaxID=43366 RepID=A0AAN9FBZ6_CLITE
MKQTEEEGFVKKFENLGLKDLEVGSENGGEIVNASHESLVSDAEWACESPNGGSSTASGWRSFDLKPPSFPYSTSLSAEEQATVAVLHLQHKALEACQEFLGSKVDSDGDKDDSDDEDEDDSDDEEESVDDYDSKECVEYKFFEKVFAEDDGLRRYYKNNHKEGDFYCLVCGGIGKKVWKRFKDCIGLIHHSTAIQRTKRTRAHRAYARVICKVVGWDIDQLPAIVLKDSDSSFAGSRKLLVEPKIPAAASVDDSNVEPKIPVAASIDDSNAEPDNSVDNHTDG